MRSATRREDLWMLLVLRDFPSSAALPAAFFHLEAGRGYRWHYMQRVEQVPVSAEDEDKRLEELPPPALKASDLILLVELYFDGTRLMSHAVSGAKMREMLRSGSVCLPPQVPWARTVSLVPDLDHGCWHWWGLEFMDVDHGDVQAHIQPHKWSASVQLMRLTDCKACVLFDSTTMQERSWDPKDGEWWNGRGEALGRAWTSSPDTFNAKRPFDRDADLIEGGMFEVTEDRLPSNTERLSGLVWAHMEAEDVSRLGFSVSPSFKLPPSPRSFVYERLVDGVSVKCENSSNFWMNRLRGRLSERWRKMDDVEKWQAFVDAGMDPAISVADLFECDYNVLGQVTFSELRLSFASADHEGYFGMWIGLGDDELPEHDCDRLLMHMLDALVWK